MQRLCIACWLQLPAGRVKNRHTALLDTTRWIAL